MGGDLAWLHPGRGGQELGQFPGPRLAGAPDRQQVALRVQLKPALVDPAVQVGGELGDPQQRPVDVDQDGRAVEERQAARQPEVPVKPGVEQRAAVDLDPGLQPAAVPASGLGLTLKVGESVWAATMRTGVVSVTVSGTLQAITDPSRTRCPRPLSAPAVPAATGNPAADSRRPASAATWKDDGPRVMKSASSRATDASGSISTPYPRNSR